MAQPGTTFTYRGVRFSTITDSAPDESYSLNNSRVVLTYQVPYSERYEARNALLGDNEVISDGASGYFVSRTTPHPMPFLPEKFRSILNAEAMYAVALVSMKGVAINDTLQGLPQYAHARLTVAYEFVPYDVFPDDHPELSLATGRPDESSLVRYVSREEEDAARFLAYRQGSWIFLDGPNANRACAQEVPLLLPVTNLTYIWHHVPYAGIPLDIYSSLKGKSNSIPFDGHTVETCVFNGAAIKMTRQHHGRRTADVHIKISHFPNGANKFPDPNDNNTFRSIGRTIAGPATLKPHPPADLHALFRPNAP